MARTAPPSRFRPFLRRAATLAIAWQLLTASSADADVPVRTDAAPATAAPATAAAVAPAEAPRDLSKYKEESVPGGSLMIVAYLVMWGLLGGFAVRMALRQGKLEREVANLQDRLDRGA